MQRPWVQKGRRKEGRKRGGREERERKKERERRRRRSKKREEEEEGRREKREETGREEHVRTPEPRLRVARGQSSPGCGLSQAEPGLLRSSHPLETTHFPCQTP